MKTKILLTTLSFILFTFLTFSQSEKSIKEKLKNVKEVKKIVVTSDKGDIVFEDDEAEIIFNKIKSKEMKRIKVVTNGEKILTEDFEGIDDDEIIIWEIEDGGGKILKRKDKGNKMMMFMDDDDTSLVKDKRIIKINVEEENGEKTVTVKTIENGKDKVETYSGKEADEYLAKLEKEKGIISEVDFDSDDDFTWVNVDSDSNLIEKKVEVKIENGNKKITVTTIKNGEESIEMFEGAEADKYLNSERDGKKVKVKEEIVDGKKTNRIIIKEEDNNN